MASDVNNGFTKDFKVNEEYGVNSLPIKEGLCMKETGSAKLDTSFSKYYLEASVNGKLTIPGQDSSYCYAYSYNPLDFKYNYGDGECKFTVSTYAHDILLCMYPIYVLLLSQLPSQQYSTVQCSAVFLTSRPCDDCVFLSTD